MIEYNELIGDFSDPEADMILECVLHSDTAELPKYATSSSACFDLRADLRAGETLTAYCQNNAWEDVRVGISEGIFIPPHTRVLIPTNVEFVIPEGYKILIYPRSGLSLKQGLDLANGIGVIDHDYHHPTFVLLRNTTDVYVRVVNKDRIAQAELVPARYCSRLTQINERLDTTTTREGGMGSTGVQ